MQDIEKAIDVNGTTKFEIYTNSKGVKMVRFLSITGDIVKFSYAAFEKHFILKGAQ